MIKAHKIRLHPTAEQKVYFVKAAGTARFVWNWALAQWNRQYEAGEHPTVLNLKKQFNAIRREHFPWTWEVTKNASDQPFLFEALRLIGLSDQAVDGIGSDDDVNLAADAG